MNASTLFKLTFSYRRLHKLYYDGIRYKSSAGIDGISRRSFEARFAENIEIICRKVRDGSYCFSQYRERLLSKGPNKFPRVISIPTMRDKLVLKAFFDILASVFDNEAIPLHTIVTDVSTLVKSGKYDSVIRLDVKDFYPSIQHDLLLKEVRRRVRKAEILALIENAISRSTVAKAICGHRDISKKGVPQGLAISNILANIYMSPIDRLYRSQARFRYFRYVDDILILCNCRNAARIKIKIVKDCEKRGLNLHSEDPEKAISCDLSEGFTYLGYSFNGRNISVRRKSVDSIRETIISLFTNYKYSRSMDLTLLKWAVDLRITGCIFKQTKYGWLFFFSQINDLQLLGSLDHFLDKQIQRFGIDPNKFKVKTFIRAFHEITKNLKRSSYIPNFDIYTNETKSVILSDIFRVQTKLMSNEEIEYEFNRRIYRTVKDLEKDLARIS